MFGSGGLLRKERKEEVNQTHNLWSARQIVNWLGRQWRKINWKSSKVIVPALVLTIALAGVGIFLGTANAAWTIMVNGKTVAVVHSKSEAENVLHTALVEKGKSVGLIAFTNDQVTFNPVRVRDIDINTELMAVGYLESQLHTYVKGYDIIENGNSLFVLATKKQAEEVLQEVKNHYAQPSTHRNILTVGFQEPVNIVAANVQPDQIVTAAKAVQEILAGSEQKVVYKIQPNDTLWTIARKNDMMISDLVANNPGLDQGNILKMGQTLNIVKVQPYLHVLVKGTIMQDEVIPFATVFKDDANLSPGSSKTLNQGVAGAKTVQYSFTAVNGQTMQSTEVSENVTQQPVNRVIAQGPQLTMYVASISRGSGYTGGLIWPLHGPITSPFGPRRLGGFHTGIDIGVGVGTPYHAAASGVVTLAGWDGPYGKCIVIDHGNGVQTRYAHSSALSVHVGDRVSQGQEIGLSGNTGNTTGPHLHFEVIINGKPVNPLNYL